MTVVKLFPEAMDGLLKSPDGVLGRWMQERGRIVQLAAIRDCPKSSTHSGGVALSESIRMRWNPTLNGQMITVGAYKPYAVFVHEGTRAHVIHGNPLLAFLWPKVGDGIFIRASVQHPGTKAQRFLSDNLPLFLAGA